MFLKNHSRPSPMGAIRVKFLELKTRRYHTEDIAAIMHGIWLRLLRGAWL
jgi:hypothetical protein